MTVRRTTVLFAALSILACSTEEPTGPDQPRLPDGALNAPADVTVDALPACTAFWASGVDGNWNDATKWSPAVVPGPTTSVCIDAPGTYRVTIEDFPTAKAAALRVGGNGATVTLSDEAAGRGQLEVGKGIRIAPGSELAPEYCGIYVKVDSGGVVTNNGTIRAGTQTCSNHSWLSSIRADTVISTGTMSFPRRVDFEFVRGGLFRNTGDIDVDNVVYVSFSRHGLAALNGGTIGGDGSFEIRGQTGGGVRARVEWNGGILEESGSTPGEAVVSVWADTAVIRNTNLRGWLRLNTWHAESTVVRGNIGRSTHLLVGSCQQSRYEFRRATGDPITVLGELVFRDRPCSGWENTVVGALVNRGVLVVESEAATRLALDSLVNQGRVTVRQDVDFDVPGADLRNEGDLVVDPGATLTMGLGTNFWSMPNGRQGGALVLDRARLQGVGKLGDVVALTGTIVPGVDVPQSPIGALSAQSLVLDRSSLVEMEVRGTGAGQHDELVVGNVTYGGTLQLITLAPYAGGTCGEVLRLIRDNSTGPRGAFSTLVGLHPGPTAWWRASYPTGAFDLVGYDPNVPVAITATPLVVSEGGASASYNACLSRAPTAPVTVTPSDTASQLTFTGSPLVFPTSGWERPLTVQLTATDDAVIEPPKVSLVRHQATSSDPFFNNVNVASFPVTVVDNDGSADLALSITSVPPPLTVNTVFTTNFRVTNNGPTLSTGATFNVPVSGGFTYLSSTGATCTVNGTSGVTCTIAGVASGGSVNFSITARARAVGTWPVTMQVTGHQADPSAGNNVLNRNLTVN